MTSNGVATALFVACPRMSTASVIFRPYPRDGGHTKAYRSYDEYPLDTML